MDINNDELRRELRDLDKEHREVMPKWRDSLMRLFEDKETPTGVKADFILGGFNRRRFMNLGALAAVGGAVMAACGDDKKDEGSSGTTGTTAAAAPTTSTTMAHTDTDLVIARTAASVENFAVVVYDTAIKAAEALKISEGVAKAAVLFKSQHEEHAKAFNAAAVAFGGMAYTEANPVAAKAFDPAIKALRTEQDVLKFAFDLETIAAQTYQKVGMMLSTPTLRQTAMTVGGVEARHVAILGSFIKPAKSEPAAAFQPTAKAIDSKFFV